MDFPKYSDVRITSNSNDKDKIIFSTFNMKNGDIGIDVRTAKYIREKDMKGVDFPEKESFLISIHASKKSKSGNIITYKIKSKDGSVNNKYHRFTRSIKSQEFSIIYSRLLPMIDDESFETNDGEKKFIRLWDYNPETTTRIITVAAGSIESNCNFSDCDFFNIHQFSINKIRFIIFDTIIAIPSTPHGDIPLFPTSNDGNSPYPREEDEFLKIYDTISAMGSIHIIIDQLYKKYLHRLSIITGKEKFDLISEYFSPASMIIFKSYQETLNSLDPAYFKRMTEIRNVLKRYF